ncbi:MAG: hypothetical protein Q7V31_03625 [Parvibaculum sp.]|uniref:hypothetical protein n=1 Tax=Parvibaculum sp. TaxID=2024848 RepID=UPI002716F1D0|nr:hypothetical protein [Parvibaculum sp.]MDO8837992.1 hypothetical protein [Parvibaculum sp.]
MSDREDTAAVAALRKILAAYEDPDMSHLAFRVHAAQIADEALGGAYKAATTDFLASLTGAALAARRCRVCGCTQNNACMTDEGPCYWIEKDLCSGCLDREDVQ